MTTKWRIGREVVCCRKSRLAPFLLPLLTVLIWSNTSSAQGIPPGSPNTGDFMEHEIDRPHAFGDWGGVRPKLTNEGVTFDFHYLADLLTNVSGKQQEYYKGWDRFRGTVDVDFGKLKGWQGLTLHATAVWQFGGNLGTSLGTIANPSGFASKHTTRLDSLWLQQALLGGKLFLKVGQFGAQDFYGVQQYGASFLGEPVLYAPGNLFENVFESADPASTPAAEIRFVPNPHVYVKAAITSANRDPFVQDPTGLHFAIRNNGTGVYETGFLTHPPGSKNAAGKKSYPGLYRLGGSYNGGLFMNPATRVTSHGNYVIYAMANQALYRERAGSEQGLDAFVTVDYSPGDVSRVNTETTLGTRYFGLLPHRERDSLGVSLIYSKISDTFNLAYLDSGLPVLGSEKVLEINYKIRIAPWWYVQPGYQHYWSIGANPQAGNTNILGFRTKVTF